MSKVVTGEHSCFLIKFIAMLFEICISDLYYDRYVIMEGDRGF